MGVIRYEPSGSAVTVIVCGFAPTPETRALRPAMPLNLIWNASRTRRTWTAAPAQSKRALNSLGLLEYASDMFWIPLRGRR